MKEKSTARLKVEIKKINAELNRRQEKERKEKWVPFLLSFKGKCYKYHNSYGGDDVAMKWYSYRRIVDAVLDKEGYVFLIYEEFQIDCYGKLTYEIGNDFVMHDGRQPMGFWTPIQLPDYEKAYANFKQQLILIDKMRKYIAEKA